MRRTLIALLAACAALAPTSANALQIVPNTDPGGFYSTVPAPSSEAPGAVLSVQDVPAGVLDGVVEAKRFSYASTHPTGRTVPVTGIVMVPSAPWTGPGGRPVALVAPGTQGAGDACAPSKLIGYGAEYEELPVSVLLQRGFAVAMTDYQGIGTPGAHTYMNRFAQGAAVLDMGRAITQLGIPGIDASTRQVTWEYSQGGGASAAAAEMHASYAPDVNLVAGFGGGVPADLLTTARSLEGSPLIGAVGYAVTGLYEVHPELQQMVESTLNDAGVAWLHQGGSDCIFETFATMPVPDSSIYTRSGQRITDVLAEEQFRPYFEEQRLGTVAPDIPMFIMQGTNDDIIPAAQAREMVSGWRERGAAVDYQEDPAPLLVRMQGHEGPLASSFEPAFAWVMGRLAEG